MTSGLQPINAGAPQPVPGVTGGPGINSGTASIDPSNGALVFHPQPANVVQVRGSTPGAFQVYEYSHSSTDFSRVALEAQTGGPFLLQVQTDPTTVIRDLDIMASGALEFGTNDTLQWQIDGSGNLNPLVDVELQIGNLSSNRVLAAYLVNTFTNNIWPIGGGDLVIGNSGTPFWRFANSGDLVPETHMAYNIGAASSYVRTLFVATPLHVTHDGFLQANGTQATNPLVRGSTGVGPVNQAATGWMEALVDEVTTVYFPYWT